MSRIPSVNSERVRWCCREHGITVVELADQLKVDAARLDAAALREDGLTFNQLQKLAGYFHRGVLFFLESGPVNANRLHSPQFRTLANQKPNLPPKVLALVERAERHRNLYLSLLDDLGETPPRFQPPRLRGTDPARVAAAIRRWLGLNDEDSFETYRAAVEACGVLVFRSNGYAGAWQLPADSPICGFSLYEQHCPVIFVRRLHPESRQTFTLMHELGHLLLHKTSFIDGEDDLYSVRGREREANQFAGHILVPNEHLALIDDDQRPIDVSAFDGWLKPFKTRWGVSGEVILRRLLDVGRIQREDYDGYRRLVLANLANMTSGRGDRSYRHREPRHILGTPFVRVVFDALNTEQISLSKASTYLDNLKIKDVHALEEHLANL